MHADVRRLTVATLLILVFTTGLVSGDDVEFDESTPRNVQTLPIHYNEIITMMVGQNSGRWIRFRIRWDLDESYLFLAPSTFSNTWRSLPTTDAYGQQRVTEMITIGTALRRFPFVVGSAPGDTRETAEGVVYDGVLGLGHASAIWIGWQSHTYQSSELTLGKALPARKSAPGSSAVRGQSAPLWMTLSLRDVGMTVPYGMELRARFGGNDAVHFERLCLEGGGEDLLFSSAQKNPHLATLIDMNFTHAEHCARLSAIDYRIIISPGSDYTVLPPQMAFLTDRHMPVEMRLWAPIAGETAEDDAVRMTVFDPRGDYFTMSRNDAPHKEMASTFGDREDFILVGAATLRRFTWAYDHFSGITWLTESVAALSDDDGGYTRPPESYILLVGAFVWVMWAVIVYPIWKTGKLTRQPAPAKLAPVKPAVPTVRVQRLPAGGDNAHPPAKAAAVHSNEQLAQRHLVAARHSIFSARLEWPYSVTVIRELQALTSAVVLLIFYISVAHLDVVHFMVELMETEQLSAILALALWFVIIVLVALTAAVLVERRPSLSACLVQLPVLMALMAMDVSSIRADMSVLVLLVLLSVTGTVALTCALRSIDYFGNGKGAPLCMLCLGSAAVVLAMAMFVLMPFAIERMWSSHPEPALMAVAMVLIVVVPASLYIMQGELMYPESVLAEYTKLIHSKYKTKSE